MLAPLIAAVLLSPLPGAETTDLLSVEWLTSESSLVFVGTPLERTVSRAASGHLLARERYLLGEVLKGPQSRGDTVTVHTLMLDVPGPEWLENDQARLWFCKASGSSEFGLTGKYAAAAPRPKRSSFPVGEPLSDPLNARPLDGYFSPEFQPIALYEELEGRARRHAAWEARVRTLTGGLEADVVLRGLQDRIDKDGTITLPTVLLRNGVSQGVHWPLFRDRNGAPLLRWPEERHRAPARIEFQQDDIKLIPVKNGQRAFSNRRYIWESVPPFLRGWQCTMNAGGVARPRPARVTVSGHVYLAMALREARNLGTDEWKPAAIERDLDFHYNDSGRTTMKVLSKYFEAGETVTFPVTEWTGSVVLIPPAWL